MKYQVTLESGRQTIVDSDLSYSEFAKGFGPSVDIQVIPVAPVLEEVVAPRPARKKAKDAE